MMETSINSASPFVCNLDAIDPQERPQHTITTAELFHSVQAVRELADGYAFLLPNETTLLKKAVEFIANERLCCPFFGFSLEIEPGGGALWLRLTGREGVKPFIRAELGDGLGDASIRAAGF